MKVSQFRRPLCRSLFAVLAGLAGVTGGLSAMAADSEGQRSEASVTASPAPSAASADGAVNHQEAKTETGAKAAPASEFEPPAKFLAKIYKMGSGRKNLLFSYTHVSVPTPKGFLFTNTYSDTDGNVAAVETTDVIKDGDQLRVHLYKMSQKQIGTEGALEVKDGTGYFTFTKNGKTEKSSESVGDDLVVGPTLLSYLHHRHDKIQNGDKVKARFVVLDRLETVGFEYYKEKDLEYEGKKAIMIKMKPSSFVVAAVVDPLHFIVPADGSRVWQVDGRTQLKLKDGDKWRDLDAETVYEYP